MFFENGLVKKIIKYHIEKGFYGVQHKICSDQVNFLTERAALLLLFVLSGSFRKPGQ